MKSLRTLLAVLGLLGSPVLLPVFALSTISATCASSHPPTEQRRPWTTDAQAALVVAAHLIDGADAFAAQRYTAETQAPGAVLNTIDQKYSPITTARRIARPALLSAQSAIAVVAQLVRDHADSAVVSTAACQAYVFIRSARGAITQLAEALAAAGLSGAPNFAASLNALTSVMSAGPVCAPGAP